jgi:hypothetical protein
MNTIKMHHLHNIVKYIRYEVQNYYSEYFIC